MKRILSILIAVIVMSAAVCSAFAEAETVPADIAAYAADDGAPFAKAFMKNPDNGFIGNAVASAEDVDALTIGSGFRLYGIDFNGNGKLASAYPLDEWSFPLELNGEFKVFFDVIREEDGKLSKAGAEPAANFNSAMGIMERLAEAEGVSDEPVILRPLLNYVICLSFNGDERVIVVPTSAFEFDKAYLSVEDHTQLPTLREYIDAVNAGRQTGAPEDAAGGAVVTLATHPKGYTEVQNKSVYPYIIIAAAAAVLVAAAAVLLKRKAGKTE